ncbi:copper resistance CopC/CopD family protein [Alcaligenes parafaecalis]|uniref:Copper resistance protein CopC n=1 Tax=Alcaligenes parafaecalis TaxID=171260 RepID=A0ABT3VIE2_9BURK|nr:copper resistance protein CopC [Alcaligenes parafaecalis]MCX5462987.1 copper resistance protein CopC [Alcaligenes parafaecalis]
MHTQILRGRAAYHSLAMLLAVLLLLTWAPILHAHASLVASSPDSGAILSQHPRTVSLSFNESVSPLLMKLIRPDGSTESLEEPRMQNNGLELALPPLEDQGTYGLSWRVISADGHPVGGTLTFSVGVPSSANQLDSNGNDPVRNSLIWLSRLLGYLGLFTGIAWALYRAQISTSTDSAVRPGRLSPIMLALGAIALLLNLGLVGVDALDLPLSALLSGTAWKTAASTSMGLAVLLGWTALACAALSWTLPHPKKQKWLAVLALILLGGSLAASGHASTAEPAWLSRPSVWLHVVAVTLWIGSFLPLAYTLKQGQESRLLAMFSRWIPAVLLILTLSGAALIYVQFDQLSSLWESAYGQVLGIKLILVALLLGLGAYNRYRLTQAVLQQDSHARQAMRRVIRLEYLLVVLILAVVALWRFTPPPRALAQLAAPSISTHVHTDAGMADLIYLPASAQHPASLTVALYEADFSPLKAQEVEVIFSNPQAGVESISFPAQPTLQNQWEVSTIELPHLASWNIRIQVLISDFERIHLDTTLDLQAQ